MLFCVVGASTALTYWGFGVAAHAMEECFGQFHRVHCTSAAEMYEQWGHRNDRSVLFTTDYLEESVWELLRDSGAPIVALTDTAEVAIKAAAKLRALSCFDAIRISSLYISSLAQALAHESTIVFSAETRNMRVADFIPQFLSALNISDPEIATRVLRRVVTSDLQQESLTVQDVLDRSQGRNELDEVASTWSIAELECYKQIAADYQNILDCSPREFVWPAAILYSATPGFRTDKPLDLLGPARLLVWGPYMHLTKGHWTASMEFEVVGNFSPNSVIADVLVGGEFAGLGQFDLPERGVYTWRLAFEVAEIAKPIEVRLTLDKAAIEGEFFLRQVRLQPIAGTTRRTLYDFTETARRPNPRSLSTPR
jgi:hypothetical protein